MLDFVFPAVAAQFRAHTALNDGRKGAEASRTFRAQAVADLVLAHGKGGKEEAYFLIPYFPEAEHAFPEPGVAAGGFPGFAACGLGVQEQEVSPSCRSSFSRAHHHIRMHVAAGNDVPVFQQARAVSGLLPWETSSPASVSGVLHGTVFHRFLPDAVVGAFHGDGIPRGGNGIFQGEVAEGGIGINVPSALFPADGDAVPWLPSVRSFPLMRKALSKVNRVSFVLAIVLTGTPSYRISASMSSMPSLVWRR